MGRGEASRLDHSRRPYDGQLRVSVRGSDVPSRAAFAYFAASAFRAGGYFQRTMFIFPQEEGKYIAGRHTRKTTPELDCRHAPDNIRA